MNDILNLLLGHALDRSRSKRITIVESFLQKLDLVHSRVGLPIREDVPYFLDADTVHAFDSFNECNSFLCSPEAICH